MLHIILLILKIIGIILLCILGIVLLAMCCALFVPVRYRIEVLREEGEGKPPVVVRVKITWLLHLVNILACYPADVYVRARIFLFTLFRYPEADGQKKEARPAKQDKDRKEKEDIVRPDSDTDHELHLSELEISVSEANESPKAAEEPSGLIDKIIRKIHDFIERIEQVIGRLKTAVENIRYTIRHLCDKMKSMLDTIQYYRDVIESDSFKHSWALCSKQIGCILKELKPDTFESNLIVGMEDPATTGEILAICGMLYPFIGQHVQIVGDFERAHIEGWIYIKGKIRAFTFLWAAVKVYRNKDIKALIKLLKKEAV